MSVGVATQVITRDGMQGCSRLRLRSELQSEIAEVVRTSAITLYTFARWLQCLKTPSTSVRGLRQPKIGQRPTVRLENTCSAAIEEYNQRGLYWNQLRDLVPLTYVSVGVV
jgi:hypothetical protein